MPRFVVIAALLALLVPTALAEPIATVAIGPGGTVSTDKNEPYYLAFDVSAPEAPRQGQPQDDCAFRPPPQPGEPDPRGGTREPSTIEKLLAWDPTTSGSFSDWFPTCAWVDLQAGTGAYASYNVSTGRYYARVGNSAIPGGTAGFAMTDLTVSGTSGAGAKADCFGCPTPP